MLKLLSSGTSLHSPSRDCDPSCATLAFFYPEVFFTAGIILIIPSATQQLFHGSFYFVLLVSFKLTFSVHDLQVVCPYNHWIY